MSAHKVHVEFPGRIVFVGFGSIGQGVLPLVLRHVGVSADRITIVTAEDRRRRIFEVEVMQHGDRLEHHVVAVLEYRHPTAGVHRHHLRRLLFLER